MSRVAYQHGNDGPVATFCCDRREQDESATRGKCDLLISFFDGHDFHRNAVNATLNPSFARLQKKYARFLGTPDFFSRKEIVEAAEELAKIIVRGESLSVGWDVNLKVCVHVLSVSFWYVSSPETEPYS